VIITDFPETAHTSSSSKTIRHVFFCFSPKTNFGVEIAPTNFGGEGGDKRYFTNCL